MGLRWYIRNVCTPALHERSCEQNFESFLGDRWHCAAANSIHDQIEHLSSVISQCLGYFLLPASFP